MKTLGKFRGAPGGWAVHKVTQCMVTSQKNCRNLGSRLHAAIALAALIRDTVSKARVWKKIIDKHTPNRSLGQGLSTSRGVRYYGFVAIYYAVYCRSTHMYSASLMRNTICHTPYIYIFQSNFPFEDFIRKSARVLHLISDKAPTAARA